MDGEKYKRLKMFISTLLITSILFVIATTSRADGYEISIYSALPWYFWLLVIISYLWGISIGFENILYKQNTDKFSLYIPIFTMAFTTLILLLMPLIRGYPTYGRGDVMDHIGYIKDILITGSFGENWYPVLHIFGASFSELTTVTPETIPMIFPSFFFIVYFIGVFYLAKELFNKKIAFLVLLISLVPLQRYYIFAPHTMVFLMLPFMLYLFIRCMREKRYIVLFLINLFPFIVFHPLRSLFFILTILIIFITINIYKKDWKANYNLGYGTNLIILSSVIWIIWYLMYYRAQTTLNIFRTFITGIYTAGQEEYTGIVAEFSPPFLYLIRIGTFRFGVVGILTLLSIILILLYFSNYLDFLSRKIFKRDFFEHFEESKILADHKPKTITIISLFACFTILTGSFFLTGAPGGYIRFLPYIVLFSCFLVAFLYYLVNEDITSFFKKYKITHALYVFTVILIVLSVLSFYRSPLGGYQNSQVTEKEFSGMEWTFENRNQSLLIEEITGFSQRRFHRAIYSRSAEEMNIRKPGLIEFPPHFGYKGNETLGSQYEENKYLVIAEVNRIRYSELYRGWEAAQFFVEEDFEKLESDETVNKIYSNGGFDFYYISS